MKKEQEYEELMKKKIKVILNNRDEKEMISLVVELNKKIEQEFGVQS